MNGRLFRRRFVVRMDERQRNVRGNIHPRFAHIRVSCGIIDFLLQMAAAHLDDGQADPTDIHTLDIAFFVGENGTNDLSRR